MPNKELAAEAVSDPACPLSPTEAVDEFDGRRHIVLHHIVEVEGADPLGLMRLTGPAVLEQEDIIACVMKRSNEGAVFVCIHGPWVEVC